LFMERVILDSCYSAIVFLKRLIDVKSEKKEVITYFQFGIIENLVSIKDKLPERDKQFIWHIWCHRGSKKLTERELTMLMDIHYTYNKSKKVKKTISQ